VNPTDPTASAGDASPLLALEQVDFGYGDTRLLRGCDLRLEPGERVALVGPNGAGKSTLLQLLLGLVRPDAGRIIAFGAVCRRERDFVPVRRRVGLVFQDPDDQLFCPTVLEDVAFGPLNLGRTAGEARADAQAALDSVGLMHLAERVPHRLSAGEKRLIALATVLAMRPSVLLLDEPSNGLDQDARNRLMDHLGHLGAQDAVTMLIVSHDHALLERLATRAVALVDGALLPATLHVHPHTHRHSHFHVHAPGIDESMHEQGPAPAHGDHHASAAPPGAAQADNCPESR
jgi:cobalt/nickel transport system ATP-binding protein